MKITVKVRPANTSCNIGRCGSKMWCYCFKAILGSRYGVFEALSLAPFIATKIPYKTVLKTAVSGINIAARQSYGVRSSVYNHQYITKVIYV